jgi:hypothetical protein
MNPMLLYKVVAVRGSQVILVQSDYLMMELDMMYCGDRI